ncbi:hypothetical protein IE53DRAFT_130680 [Violaceomyces palustris]|uniref:Uncharacterized protein n=1 Tax=Violaceomyces palustris TaxID=1673888 RepID=A0ACD0NV68_9BASI|nr:hypothetical protein IE53DRAFT_130680 [Violaceomyces palustris]
MLVERRKDEGWLSSFEWEKGARNEAKATRETKGGENERRKTKIKKKRKGTERKPSFKREKGERSQAQGEGTSVYFDQRGEGDGYCVTVGSFPCVVPRPAY